MRLTLTERRSQADDDTAIGVMDLYVKQVVRVYPARVWVQDRCGLMRGSVHSGCGWGHGTYVAA